MSQSEQIESFIDNLHRAIAEDTVIASDSIKDNRERWQVVSESISSIANALFSEDTDGRRSFINVVLGIEIETQDNTNS